MSSNISLVGVNLSGGEFGSGVANYGTNYEYPTDGEIAYEASKGMNVLRVPFLWERLQPQLNGPLDPTELGRINHVVQYATSLGMKVDLDVHDYGKYNGQQIGSSSVPTSSFSDLWSRIATNFKSNPNVLFGLMNEPSQTDAQSWVNSENAAIAAIRNAGATQEILVSGINYDGAWTWVGSPNDTVISKQIKDPLKNYAIEVHQYLDQDGSGTNFGPVYDTDGADRITQITTWAEQNHQKLFLGEIGVPPDDTSVAALGNVLSYMSQHTDAWQGVTYWAAGPLWKPYNGLPDYPLSAEPTTDPQGKYIDKPQMKVLEKYASSANNTPAPMQAPVVVIKGISGGSNIVDHVVSGTVDAADAGSVVTVTNGNTALGSAMSDANGNWSLPFSYTGDGTNYSYSLIATATNMKGTGASAAMALALSFATNRSSFGTISYDTNHPGGEIYALYEGLLGRAPDAQGAEGWVASLNSGTTVAQVAEAFLDSPEAQQTFSPGSSNKSFVETLYQRVLGRKADAGGEQAWINSLNAGESRADVANAFVFSNEHVSQLQPALDAGIFVADANTSAVARLYYGLLDRAPDMGGLSANTRALDGGVSIQGLAQSFISSNEYRSHYANLTDSQFIADLYQNALGRAPDQGGLQAWDNQLAAGSSRASVAVSIIQSQEGKNHLAGQIETGFHFA